MSEYRFECGCSFPIISSEDKDCDGLPSFEIDFENLRLDCPATWDLLSSGKTKGIFQLETQLGQSWAEKVKPTNLEEMSALISVLRPGTLKAVVDGKSMTQHYADRKNGLEEINYFHQALEPILKDTLNISVYQEQSMRIASDIAGFSLQEADTLRKSIGKKLPKLMASLKEDFINGCKKQNIVNEEQAETIFGWIQESQKYAFCKAHACGYGLVGYWTAYAKTHFPWHFFTSWLHYAKEKINPQEEIGELVLDAKNFEVKIQSPSILLAKEHQGVTLTPSSIYFGINDIKGIGGKATEKIIKNIEEIENLLKKSIKDWSWYEFLIHYTPISNKTVINGLIASGALSQFKISRSRMLFEYNIIEEQLTKKDIEFIKDCSNIEEALNKLLFRPRLTEKRKMIVQSIIDTLKDTPYSMSDNPRIIYEQEKELLGVSLTYSALDTYNTNIGDTSCRDFADGKCGEMNFVVEILNIREWIAKNGKKMCFLSVGDDSGSINSVVAFTEIFNKYRSLLYKGAVVLLKGTRNIHNGQHSLVVNSVTGING